jgi:hypothetical protein
MMKATRYRLEIGRRYRFVDLPWGGYTDPKHVPLVHPSMYFSDQRDGWDGIYDGPHSDPYRPGANVEPLIAGLTPGQAYDFGRLEFMFWSDYAADNGERDLHDWFSIVRTDQQTIGVYCGPQNGVEPIFARSSIVKQVIGYVVISNDRGPVFACVSMDDAVWIARHGQRSDPQCIDQRDGVVTPLRVRQLQAYMDAGNVRSDEYGSSQWQRYRLTARYVRAIPDGVPIYLGEEPWDGIYGESVQMQKMEN